MNQKRNRRSGVEDRWHLARKDDTGKLVRSAKYGVGKRWRARYVDESGAEREKLFTLKAEAQEWLDGITSSMVTGTYVAPGAGSVTVGQMRAQWIGTFGHLKETTKATRETVWNKHVRDRWQSVRINEIQTSGVRAWVQDMRAEGAKAATIENALGILRMILELAVEDRRLPRNPCQGVKPPRREHSARAYLTHQQVDQLATAVGERYRPVILFLGYTGLRYGEMAALRVENFDMLRRRVNVRQSVTEVKGKLVWSSPKNHERRSVPFPRFLADDLAALMAGKSRDDLVFTAPEGGVLRLATFRTRTFTGAINSLRPVDERGNVTSGFPKATIHDLRHTAASLAISAGANVKAVQTMLGHQSAALTLDTYADLFPDDLERVAEALDEARRAAAGHLRAAGHEAD
ncbi:site-specific integrase [Gordonia polyisoprenivorans]|uniref:tyrosine-type recombinase/integrase n=1 Tax=Gordonia polyisoprenivorans TaxID=84595 RepID=UPI001B8D1D64|nr:site-specific integrase [Gordonia polyisoprenivorans]QUD82106.1 site-specific integrase [Gordonia polyisoprenivorans]